MKFFICLCDDFGSAFLLWMVSEYFSVKFQVILLGSITSYLSELARVHGKVSERNSEIMHYASLIAVVAVPIKIIFTFEMAPSTLLFI